MRTSVSSLLLVLVTWVAFTAEGSEALGAYPRRKRLAQRSPNRRRLSKSSKAASAGSGGQTASPPSGGTTSSTFPVQSITDVNSNSVVSECTSPLPSAGISTVARQLVTYQYALQLISYSGTHQAKATGLEQAIHDLLKTDLLLCNYFSTANVNPEIFRLDTHSPDTVVPGAACGENCVVVNADITIDLFYYEGGRRDRRGRRYQRTRNLQPASTKATISDNALVIRLGEALRSTLFDLNVADTTASFNFLGITNAAVTDTLGDGNLPPTSGGGAAGATDGDRGQASNKGAVATGFIVIGCAAIVLMVVAVMAVKRHKLNRAFKLFMLEEDDADQLYRGSAADDDDDDQEKASNPTTTPDDILADLHSLHDSSGDDQEVASASSYSTQSHEVYVLSETNVSYAASIGSPDRYGLYDTPEQQQQPTDTDSLKKAMKDLNRQRPPVGAARGYVSSDTVHL